MTGRKRYKAIAVAFFLIVCSVIIIAVFVGIRRSENIARNTETEDSTVSAETTAMQSNDDENLKSEESEFSMDVTDAVDSESDEATSISAGEIDVMDDDDAEFADDEGEVSLEDNYSAFTDAEVTMPVIP